MHTLASEYRKAGYLIGVSHRVMTLNRDRIVAELGPIFDDGEGAGLPGSDGRQDADDAEEAGRADADDALEDDDPPF